MNRAPCMNILTHFFLSYSETATRNNNLSNRPREKAIALMRAEARSLKCKGKKKEKISRFAFRCRKIKWIDWVQRTLRSTLRTRHTIPHKNSFVFIIVVIGSVGATVKRKQNRRNAHLIHDTNRNRNRNEYNLGMTKKKSWLSLWWPGQIKCLSVV